MARPLYGPTGWEFGTEPGSTPDSVNSKSTLAEIYLVADPHYTGRVSVPVLWDKKQRTVVNNKSSEIIRMLNSAFDAFTNARSDYYPADLRPDIDRINDVIYPNINNGVYRAGFATSQAAYEEAARAIFATLDQLEERLSRQRYLVGKQTTEADWRLFTTLVRFDAVYYGHFKCNLRRIADYPNLSNYLRDLYQVPGIAETVSLDHIKRHYYGSQRQVNPTGIVPIGRSLISIAARPRRFSKEKRAIHQKAAAALPASTSVMRARVEGVVPSGRPSGAKKPCAMISRFGCGGALWRNERTT